MQKARLKNKPQLKRIKLILPQYQKAKPFRDQALKQSTTFAVKQLLQVQPRFYVPKLNKKKRRSSARTKREKKIFNPQKTRQSGSMDFDFYHQYYFLSDAIQIPIFNSPKLLVQLESSKLLDAQPSIIQLKLQHLAYNFYQMLNEKTSSANNLRIESSRRHQIRNLRAKVRSMLPQEICPKQSRFIQKNGRFGELFRANQGPIRYSQHLQKDKRLIKELQKLNYKELEEISENKHYFLGSQHIIEQFDYFMKEFHPKIKQNEWTSPLLKKSGDFPFGFVPPFYSAQKEKGSRSSLASGKKRGSTAISVHLQKTGSIMNRQIKSQFKNYKELEASCVQRKQAIKQQLKFKRQISSVHLQRQQHVAEVNRDTLLKLRIQKAKTASSLARQRKNKENDSLKQDFEDNDVRWLTTKLRKICLKRYKNYQKQ